MDRYRFYFNVSIVQVYKHTDDGKKTGWDKNRLCWIPEKSSDDFSFESLSNLLIDRNFDRQNNTQEEIYSYF